jgi:hypothetical protein
MKPWVRLLPKREDHGRAAFQKLLVTLVEGISPLALDIDQADDNAVLEDRHDDLRSRLASTSADSATS